MSRLCLCRATVAHGQIQGGVFEKLVFTSRIPRPTRNLLPLLQRMPTVYCARGPHARRSPPHPRTEGGQPMSTRTSADRSLSAASFRAPVLDSDQSACPAFENYILISRSSRPINGIHSTAFREISVHQGPSFGEFQLASASGKFLYVFSYDHTHRTGWQYSASGKTR